MCRTELRVWCECKTRHMKCIIYIHVSLCLRETGTLLLYNDKYVNCLYAITCCLHPCSLLYNLYLLFRFAVHSTLCHVDFEPASIYVEVSWSLCLCVCTVNDQTLYSAMYKTSAVKRESVRDEWVYKIFKGKKCYRQLLFFQIPNHLPKLEFFNRKKTSVVLHFCRVLLI